jgi:putative transposase
MARISRVVVPGIPHHVTQRGNRRQATFFQEQDYAAYLGFLATGCAKAGAEIWAYCLMPNHVHLIVVPRDEDGLRAAIADAHRRYTRMVNFREGWRGHLWQERFASFPMDDRHLLAAARYIELNPVRARLVKRPEAYRWSSARSHLTGKADDLVDPKAFLSRVPDWRGFLASGMTDDEARGIRAHEKTGRPLGDERFLTRLERLLKRTFRLQRTGPRVTRKMGRR